MPLLTLVGAIFTAANVAQSSQNAITKMLLYLQIFVIGLLVSLSGSLPLGSLNLTAMQIAAKEQWKKAVQFAVGVAVVEMIYIAVILSILGRIDISGRVLFIFRVISVLLLLIMAAGSFLALAHEKERNLLIDNNINRTLLGVSMSAVNPMQVPFWMGWVLYLLSQSLIVNSLAGNAVFTISAGVGTFIAMLLFIIAGRRFADWMRRKKRLVNIVMGGLFVLMAIMQIVLLF